MAVEPLQVVRFTVQGFNTSVGANQNQFHARLASGVELSNEEAGADIAELVDDIWQALATYISSAYTINNIHVVNVTADTIVGDFAPVDATPGTAAGDRHPPAINIGLSLTTEFLRVRGRKFFGPVTAAGVNTLGVVTAGAQSALSAAGAELVGNQEATNGAWLFGVIASSLITTPFVPFISFLVNPTSTIMKSRRFATGI